MNNWTGAGAEAEALEDSPLNSPASWVKYEKFNTSFQRVALGWEQFDAHAAAYEVGRSMGSKIAAVGETAEPGRLFIVGDMGYVGKRVSGSSKGLDETVKKLGDSLGLMGDFKIGKPYASLAGSYALIEQTAERLPIYGAQFTVHADQKGSAYAVVGTPAPKGLKIRIPAKKIKPEDAANVVAHNLDTTAEELAYTYEELLLPVEEELQACYLIQAVALRPFGDWNGFVDFDGNLLALFNVASAGVGQASGYKINPSRGAVESLPLKDLLDPPRSLTGQGTEIWGLNQTRVSSKDGRFVFTPAQSEFDEPQLYFFLQVCREAADGFARGKHASRLKADPKFNPMKGSVHVREANDNAFYMPDTGRLYFGDTTKGSPTRYSSRSLDLVLHEFGHALSDGICKLGRARAHDSSRAMSEGYSDYFAATVLNDPLIGEDFAPSYPRTCANKNKFPRSFAGEEHEIGTVWAGLLWGLRQEPGVGQEVADALMLLSLSYLGPWRTILQGLDALLQADRVLFPAGNGTDGQHAGAIRDAFNIRRA
jgi:Thermolysin metallopeptidase, catalytic domain